MVFAWAKAIEESARRQMERPSQRVCRGRAWRQALCLRALEPPRGPDLRQEVESACSGTAHACMGLQVFGLQPDVVLPMIFNYITH